jgi:small-conductance mechanosensitive channel
MLIAPLLVVSLLLSGSLAQTTRRTQPASLQTPVDLVRPDTIAARKAAIQTQIEALAHTDARTEMAKDERDKARLRFEQMLQLFTDLEAAWQQRTTYLTQLEKLPQRLKEVEAERQALENRPPPAFDQLTEQTRDQVEAQLQAASAELQDLLKQSASDEIRLAAIPKELDERLIERGQLIQALQAARGKSVKSTDQKPVISEADQLEVKLQLWDATIRAREAERQWLTSRGPLQDAMQRTAQTRLTALQQDLRQIKQALGASIEQEQADLSHTAAELERKLALSTDPIESMLLTVSLETTTLRQTTTELRNNLNQLSDEVLAEEQRNAQEKQDVERLAALVEKYTSGEGVAQRLWISFERLRRARGRFHDASVKEIAARLRVLSEQMFEADDRLYEFDRQVAARLATLPKIAPDAMSQPQRRDLDEIRKAFDVQKTAWREQQQVLSALVRDQTRLLTLHREYARLLDDSYLFVLTKMFWLRDSERMSLSVLRDILASALVSVNRLQDFVRAEGLRMRLAGSVPLWSLALVLFLGIPWVVTKLQQRLRYRIVTALAETARRQTLPGTAVMSLLILQSGLWPGYIILVAWLYGLFLSQSVDPLALALVAGVQVSALILWVGCLARAILRRSGWGEQVWGLSTELRHLLWRTVWIGVLAAGLFLVPRHILLIAPGDPDLATGSIALARCLLLAFQMVILVLVSIVGWRSSTLMQAVLSRSRQQEGLWWRVWPFIYLALLVGLGGIMTLDILGYHYAAQFVWLRALESFSVLVLRRLLVIFLVLRVLHGVVNALFHTGSRRLQQSETLEASLNHFFKIAYTICNTLLLVLAVGVILELWGVSVTWLLTSPLGIDVFTRAVITALTIGGTIVIIQISKTLTEYLIRPKTTVSGGAPGVSRKLRTMAPLLQTVLKVGVIFAAALVILEQLNVATGPILTGVGIFGLAVGFASQSLIKDVINGLFILFEDSLSVGDVVNLRGIGGSVEKVTLRAVTIRDLSGGVHIIPNSTLDMITNLTKDYGRYLLDVSVAYRENVDTVIAILREIDEGMRQDPTYAWDMLEPIEILGLDNFAESAIVIRARLKTTAGQQWRLGREFKRRIKITFDERGIEIPFPHRTIYWGMPKDGSPSPLHLSLVSEPSPQNGKPHLAQLQDVPPTHTE